MPEQHLTPSDISGITGATPQAINNWRKRYEDFPQPVDYDGRTPLYPAEATVAWLRTNGKLLGDSEATSGLAVRQVVDTFRAAVENVPSHEIVEKVVLPALRGSGSSSLGDVVSQVRRVVGGAGTADLIVELLARVPGHVWSEFELSSPLRDLIVGVFAGLPGATTYDGCGGFGTLLAAVTPADGRAYLQEINAEAAELAEALLEIRGIAAQVVSGDTIARDGHPGIRADRVVMAPPATISVRDVSLDDPRWEFGTARRFDASDFWIMIALAHTAPGGTAVVHLPLNILVDKADGLMEKLLRQNVLDAVIELGPGQLGGSSQESCLLVLSRNRPAPTVTEHTPILLADLSQLASRSARYQLTGEMVARFLSNVWGRWHHQRFGVESVATTMTLPELRAVDFDLRPARHVQRLEWPRPFPTGTASSNAPEHPAATDIARLVGRIRSSAVGDLSGLELRTPPVASAALVTLRDLMRRQLVVILQGAGEAGRSRGSSNTLNSAAPRVINIGDIPDNLLESGHEPDLVLRDRPTERDLGSSQRRIRTGDILIASRWPSGQRPIVGVATAGMVDSLPGRGVAAIRLEPESLEKVNARYLRWWLATPRFQHFMAVQAVGSTFEQRVQFPRLRDFEFPLPPIGQQLALVHELDAALRTIRQQEAEHRAIADAYREMSGLVLELFGAAHRIAHERR